MLSEGYYESNIATRLMTHSGYLCLHFEVMRRIGAPTRTFAACRELCNKKENRTLYHRLELIAECSGLSIRTTKRHLRHLVFFGWLECLGRLRGKKGGTMRTVTYRIPDDLWKLSRTSHFAPLPRWWTETNWARTAVYSVILGNCFKCERVAEQGGEATANLLAQGDLIHLEELSNVDIIRKTGLSCNSVSRALGWLQKRGYIVRDTSCGISIFEMRVPREFTELSALRADK